MPAYRIIYQDHAFHFHCLVIRYLLLQQTSLGSHCSRVLTVLSRTSYQGVQGRTGVVAHRYTRDSLTYLLECYCVPQI